MRNQGGLIARLLKYYEAEIRFLGAVNLVMDNCPNDRNNDAY